MPVKFAKVGYNTKRMDAKTYLSSYAPKADKFLDKFFAEKKREASSISPLCSQMMDIYREYMRGGKKARGALTFLGYQCLGGRQENVALPASVAIEIFHSFLLMHDDWIDKDLLRRGKPTVHIQYEKFFREKKWKGDRRHWGAGMAVVLGDIGCFLAYKILSDLPCLEKRKTQALSYLSDYFIKTAYGEVLDITYDFIKEAGFKDILSVRELKTAYYTIVMPLAIGASLAGADQKKIKAIEAYGLPVGIAFQLRDDELGLFGEEKTLGKSTLSDLLEGKKTMLILKALESLSDDDKKLLLSVWGQGRTDQSKAQRAKDLILKSQALAFSRKMAKDLVEQGKKFVPQITKLPKYQKLLYEMADFMIERTS